MRIPPLIWIVCLCFLALCQLGAEPSNLALRSWSEVRTFSYQLQELRIREAGNSPYDLLIVDYSHDGGHEQRLSRDEVRRLQRGPDGKRRLVLAYLSIGEAEDYRFYWSGRKAARREGWLGSPNPDWKGHYNVKFWHPAWRAIVRQYLDQILTAGFDGVYLDRIDAYEQAQSRGVASARTEMLELIEFVARRSRQKMGQNFGVFAQNAEELLVEPSYLALLTGIGRESVYYAHEGGSRGVAQSETLALEKALELAVRADKLVLSVDYPKNLQQTEWARRRAQSRGFLHFATFRALDSLDGWSFQRTGYNI